jgi:hypothetical protein
MRDKRISNDAGARRSYFFEVKASRFGQLYLSISEKRRVDTGFEVYRLLVFEEHIKDFADSFNEALVKFSKEKMEYQPAERAYSIKDIRETYGHAYLPWTEADDKLLELLYCEGLKFNVIARVFKRNEGAIVSRIKKLELNDKYPDAVSERFSGG